MQNNGNGIRDYTDGVREGAGLVEQPWAVDWIRALVRMDRSYTGIRQAFQYAGCDRTPDDLFTEMTHHLSDGIHPGRFRAEEFWAVAVDRDRRARGLSHEFLRGFCEGVIGAAFFYESSKAG